MTAQAVPSGLMVDRAQALRLVSVSRETTDRLDRLVPLLLKWQQRTNLIGPSTLARLWTRHIADSLQLLRLAPDARSWVDLGTGAGFPGLVLACALADSPGSEVHLVESNAKKAGFLREAARVLSVPALVHGRRIEDFMREYGGPADVVTARALAPLVKVLDYAGPLLTTGARGLFLKGQDVEAELTEASKYWTIHAELMPSATHPDGRIVVVHRAERRGREASR